MKHPVSVPYQACVGMARLANYPHCFTSIGRCLRIAGARLVAQFFMGLNDASSAIEFLFLAGASEDAFKLAQANGKMDVFATVLGDAGSPTDYAKVATHFESIGDLFRAAKYHVQAANYRCGGGRSWRRHYVTRLHILTWVMHYSKNDIVQ